MRYYPIEDYGVIGDLNTIALVGQHGSIDFMCFPDFDSPTIFAKMLDADKGGHFSITPLRTADIKFKQMYIPNTNILLTRFLSDDGVTEIIDFMPVYSDANEGHILIRRVIQVRGQERYRMECNPQFNYARDQHTVEEKDGAFFFTSQSKNPITLKLSSPSTICLDKQQAYAEFTLQPEDTCDFILELVTDGNKLKPWSKERVSQSIYQTMNFWKAWIRRSKYKGRWQEVVNRSALVLKLMTSRKHGTVVAAPTFGLPEKIGGDKNWDYRYNWIRDSSFVLYALIRLGYTKEASCFMHWLQETCIDLEKPGELSLMYTLDGQKYIPEFNLDHFEGYLASSPVRIGNAAHDQLQLDIYGELMDSVYLFDKYAEPLSHDLWQKLTGQINWVCQNWGLEDEGIWEVRGGKRHFLYSKLLCWVAIDRGIRLAQKRSFPMPSHWIKVRDEIYHTIFKDYWDPKKQTFVQFKGSDHVDASTLMMPLMRFISPRDPKWLSTLACIEKELVSDSLVYRYHPGHSILTGLGEGEGTFSLCSFWYVECLSRAGQLQKARLCFEKMLGYANHVGLYAEQLGFKGEHLGNFPQAFTHLGLISAAYNLNENLNDARNREV